MNKPIKFQFLKQALKLYIKRLILIMEEPKITSLEIEENNFKCRFLYEISSESFLNI